MLELRDDGLMFSFPEVHPNARCALFFHRTLRIPDDGKEYPLPASLGHFPVRRVDDFKDAVPDKWLERGGVMLPMWQSEAMWIAFGRAHVPGYGTAWPCAVKIAAGKVSAVTGKGWKDGLRKKDYCVIPQQLWLDGFVVKDGRIRQFVAAPLGSGASAEEQITGKAEFGGLQIEVFPMRREAFERRFPKRPERSAVLRSHSYGPSGCGGTFTCSLGPSAIPEYSINLISDTGHGQETRTQDMFDLCQKGSISDMAMGVGGMMRQQVFEDPYGLEDWDLEHGARCFVHLCSSTAWRQATGANPPTVPLTSAEYRAHGVPWFDLWDGEAKALKGMKKLASLKTVKQIGEEKGVPLVTEDTPIQPDHVVPLSKDVVRNGGW